MNYKTDWWGVEIFAETEADRKLLSDLNDSLKNKEPLDNYEGGEIEFIGDKLTINR